MTLFDVPGHQAPAAPASAPEDRASSAVVRMVVAYDGTDFHGFAAQRDQRTVAGELHGALTKVLRTEALELACAGRTDAGVHAWGQVVSFSAPRDVDLDRLRTSLNAMLGPEIVVRAADRVGDDFDARHSARRRSYRYTIVNRPEPDPFLARYAWHVPTPLDLAALRLGADPFVGEHDFSSSCRKGPEGSTTMRRVTHSSWHDLGDGLLRYDIRANAFCWQMVRSVVGTLIEVGAGKKRPGDILTIVRAHDRAAAG
ncbi:MAG: tRNA pseudouridine(38-40) synthase TruA, partial [Acidimicrobiia bacterium]